jgi:hypothetical protein
MKPLNQISAPNMLYLCIPEIHVGSEWAVISKVDGKDIMKNCLAILKLENGKYVLSESFNDKNRPLKTSLDKLTIQLFNPNGQLYNTRGLEANVVIKIGI